MGITFLGDLKNIATATPSIAPVAVTTGTTDGTGVDCLTFEGPMSVICSSGAWTGTYTTLQFTVTESDLLASGYGAMAEAPATIQVVPASSSAIITFWKRSKRYVRVSAVCTAGSNAVISAVVLGSKKVIGTGSGAQVT